MTNKKIQGMFADQESFQLN